MKTIKSTTLVLAATLLLGLNGCDGTPGDTLEHGFASVPSPAPTPTPTPTPTPVPDTTPPVITLLGEGTVTIEAGTAYSDAGATASDNIDGDITASIKTASNVNTSIPGTYTVTYNVSDSAGNAAATVTRTVIVVDTTLPVITLIGESNVSVTAGAAYTDAGATASDNIDGDITAAIISTGDINTSLPGTYTVTYDVSDSAGNAAATVTRTVNVVNSAPVFGALSKEIYFDTHTVATLYDAFRVFSIDLDQDGDFDILASSWFTKDIHWYENDGSQNFTERNITTNMNSTTSLTSLDFDGDGDIDILAAAHDYATVSWYENDGLQNFTEHNITNAAPNAYGIYPVDLDQDGDNDLLTASRADDRIAWYENDGSQNFTEHNISTTADGARSVFAIDIDGDGSLDPISVSSIDDKTTWYQNDGAQNFTAFYLPVTSIPSNGTFSVYAIDLDGDNDNDVLTASANDNTIAWYQNDGSGGFTEHVISNTAVWAVWVSAIDIDGDGDNDVYSASQDDNKIAWYENDGSGNFTTHIVTTSAFGATSAFSIDLDSDGDIDLLSASEYDSKIAWYEQFKVLTVVEGNTTVGTISATDADGHTLTYSISGGADAALFTIDTATGDLSFLAAPVYATPADSDTNNVYEVTVSVTDGYTTTTNDLDIYVSPAAP